MLYVFIIQIQPNSESLKLRREEKPGKILTKNKYISRQREFIINHREKSFTLLLWHHISCHPVHRVEHTTNTDCCQHCKHGFVIGTMKVHWLVKILDVPQCCLLSLVQFRPFTSKLFSAFSDPGYTRVIPCSPTSLWFRDLYLGRGPHSADMNSSDWGHFCFGSSGGGGHKGTVELSPEHHFCKYLQKK